MSIENEKNRGRKESGSDKERLLETLDVIESAREELKDILEKLNKLSPEEHDKRAALYESYKKIVEKLKEITEIHLHKEKKEK